MNQDLQYTLEEILETLRKILSLLERNAKK